MSITITTDLKLKTTSSFNEVDTKEIKFANDYNVYCNEFKEDNSFYFEVDSNGNYIVHCVELIEEDE